MRAFLLAAGAAVVVSCLPGPALSQVGVEVDVPGVGVRIGEEPEYRYRERRRRVYEENVGVCRTITVRRERRDGTVVVRRERRCD